MMQKDRATGLTPKEQRFVEEYLIDLNATGAARRAGYKNPNIEAAKVIRRQGVRVAIGRRMKARSARCQVDADQVLDFLFAQVTADLAELLDEDGEFKPVEEWPYVWRQGLVRSIETERGEDGVTRIKKITIADRTKILELLGKHVNVQAFRDQIKVEEDVDIVRRLQEGRQRVAMLHQERKEEDGRSED